MSSLKPFVGPIVVGAVALVGLASCQSSGFREAVESRLTESSDVALADAGIDGADVSFTGRDATVEAGTAAVASAAGAVVEDVDGVRAVEALGPDGAVEPGSVTAEGAEGDGSAGDGSASGDDDAGDDDAAGDDTAGDGGSDAGDDGSSTDDTADDAGSGDGSDAGQSGDDPDTDSDSAGSGDGPGDGKSSDDGSGDGGSADSDRKATAEEKEEAQEDLEELVEIDTITFVTDSADLTVEGAKVVRDAAELLDEHPDVSVRIEGHTDHVGDTSYNRTLSQDRADAVLDRLVHLGIDESRLTAEGFGESDPVVEEARNLAELEKNRRVDFIVLD